MTKIFVVTSGQYSDYGIAGIYSSKEKAEEAKKLFNADNGIAEWELDAVPKHEKGTYYWSVEMDKEGNTQNVELQDASHANKKWDWSPYGDAEKKLVYFGVWAKDENHAVKIANEKRGMLIASGEWTSDWDEWRKGR